MKTWRLDLLLLRDCKTMRDNNSPRHALPRDASTSPMLSAHAHWRRAISSDGYSSADRSSANPRLRSLFCPKKAISSKSLPLRADPSRSGFQPIPTLVDQARGKETEGGWNQSGERGGARGNRCGPEQEKKGGIKTRLNTNMERQVTEKPLRAICTKILP